MAPRLVALALLGVLLAVGLRATASPTQAVTLGRPSVASLRPGQIQRFGLALAQRDCAFGQLRGPPGALRVEVLDPSGKRSLRRFASRVGGPLDFELCVEAAGRYLLAISADAPGRFEIELQQILGRPSPAPPTAAETRLLSPRLSVLRDALSDVTRAPAALDDFWREVERAGTPLVEAGDADALLVTFLYRATPAGERVSVSWPMWSGTFAQPELLRLADSDVLFRSVKLPRATRLSYQLVIDAPRDPSPGRDFADRAERAVSRADPRNPNLMFQDPSTDAFHQRSLLELPDAAAERWLHGPRRARGRVARESLASETLGNTRAISVYLPAGYSSHTPYPLLIFFDGEQYLDELQAPELLDRLIAARAVAPLVAVFVHNATADSRVDELPCNPRFARFASEELMPWLWQRYALSRDPRQVGLAGSSFGGLAASFLALEHPGLWGKVLSQSGSFWWSFPRGHALFDGSAAPGWLRRRYQKRPHAALELYLSAGAFETQAPDGGVLEHNRLQRDALRALGYSVAYQELSAGHDPLAWRASLPDALQALFAPAP